LPIRFTFDNNYFNDRFQGIPIGGYNRLIEGLLKGVEVMLDLDFLTSRNKLSGIAKKVLYTGGIDQFFDYKLGHLKYRSLRFENELLEVENFQGNAVVNYTDINVPYTRIIEHKHFEFGQQPKTYITREYSLEYTEGLEPYYPINDNENNLLYEEYKLMAQKSENVIFGGRLGDYKYYDMDKVVEQVLKIKHTI
jgi:UDP-galactopyranose mutase